MNKEPTATPETQTQHIESPTRESAMSDDELRVKIAAICGVGYSYDAWGAHLPLYATDLNVCHEFEKLLFDEAWRRYIGFIIGKQWWDAWEFSDAATLANASARQKAEAFVATMSPVTDQRESEDCATALNPDRTNE